MKNLINTVVLIAAISLAGCSTYKVGQTPDDVYFSPGKVLQPKADVEYQQYQTYNDDQYLRMKVQNNDLWSTIDDYDYWYDSRYAFGVMNYYSPAFMYYGYNNFYSPYYSYYYNPYACYDYGYWGMYNPMYVAAYYKNPAINRSYYTGASNISAYKNKGYNVMNTGYTVTKPVSNNEQSRFNLQNNNYRNPNTYQTTTNSPSQSSQTQSSWSNPVRVSSGNYSSNTGGASGGVSNSSRSSSGGGRSGR